MRHAEHFNTKRYIQWRKKFFVQPGMQRFRRKNVIDKIRAFQTLLRKTKYTIQKKIRLLRKNTKITNFYGFVDQKSIIDNIYVIIDNKYIIKTFIVLDSVI